MAKNNNKMKSALKALGIKQEQPENLRGLAKAGAGKETRYKPGDSRLKENRGQQLQIVPPRVVATERKRMNELIKEYQHMPLAKELASAMGIEGQATLVEAVVMGLFLQAIRGDISATKLIQAITEPETDRPTPENAPLLRIKVVLPPPVATVEVADGETPEVEKTPDQPRPPFADEGEEQQ